MPDLLKRLALSSRIPKNQLLIFLTVIAVSALLFGQQTRALFVILTSVLAATASDYLFLRLRRIEPFFESAAIVSGLIIGLLLFPDSPWYYAVTAGILAMASKNFLKWRNRHIFNPAAFGLFFAGLIFRFYISWWGVIFQSFRLNPQAIFLFFLFISPGYISFYRLRRHYTIASFLLVYFLLQFTLGFGPTLLSPLLLFFSFVMLPEPMTSPNNPRLQLLFGSFVAFISITVNHLFFTQPDNLILALLLGNLLFYPLRLKYP